MKRLALGLMLLGFCLACLKASAEEPDFYQWRSSDGAISFSDDFKAIPAAYQDKAVARTWKDLKESVSNKESLIPRTEETAFTYKVVTPPANPNRPRECSHPVTIESRWIQEGDYHRKRYFVTDECGREVMATPGSPEFKITR